MSAAPKAAGQVRRSQVITTWGPGAPLDLPREAAIVAGLEHWPNTLKLDEVVDARLVRKLGQMTGVANLRLFAPPGDTAALNETPLGIGVLRFPDWMVVQEKAADAQGRRRRLVRRRRLDKGRFQGLDVVPTRFVRACSRGHIDDVDWQRFVHGATAEGEEPCRRQLWLEESGTGGDLGDLKVACDCGESRDLIEAVDQEKGGLGPCFGQRPWLGRHAAEPCDKPSRLLIRTAANAYFPQVMSALSLPEAGSAVRSAVESVWGTLQAVDSAATLTAFRKIPDVTAALAGHDDDAVLEAIEAMKGGGAEERPVKLVELDALLAVPEGYGDDVPVDPDFHARRLPDAAWRRGAVTDGVAEVIQLHRLREVLALVGFTRFESVTPDIDGEYEGDVERADLAEEPSWFPAVENRGEGVFLGLDSGAVEAWLARPAVRERLDSLSAGHERWAEKRKSSRDFAGGPYVLLHTLAHLLMQSLSLTCGYPASSIRERIYADYHGKRYGLLLYTASPDAEGTLGGLVSQARHVDAHLRVALRAGGLCANDPVCAQHSPGEGMEGRWLHGAACHGCALVSETSCEMRNDLLDRALVVPTLALPEAAFFDGVA